jgi:flagellar protein FlaG
VGHSQTKENVVELVKAKQLAGVKQAKKEVEAETLSSAIHLINERVQNLQRDLVFSVDEDTGKDVVTILDAKSSKVIRQIPSEEMLELAKNLSAQLDDIDDQAKVANLFSSKA